MSVENINDANFGKFCQSEQAVLVISKSTCPACLSYAPVIERVAETLQKVRFGQAWLDRLSPSGIIWGVVSDLYQGSPTVSFPTTLVLQGKRPPAYFAGAYDYEDVLDVIYEILNSSRVQPDESFVRLQTTSSDNLPHTSLG